MSASSARLASALLALVAVLVVAAPAAAEIGPIQLVSKTATEQAQEASETALSADGRYLAFSGSIGGFRGVFREDLQTGAIAPVIAESDFEGPPDSTAPSISADGRFVSFTTTTQLDPDDDTGAGPDVYVADMAASPPSYELVSARDGCDPTDPLSHTACGLTYSGAGGSQASGRVAISADGSKVVFYTTAGSNLTSEPGGSTEGVSTPPLQVVLRDLVSKETKLVSVERDASTGQMTDLPVGGGAMIDKPLLVRFRGAALSADGTTTAWLGAHLRAQVPLLTDEKEKIALSEAGGSSNTPYVEPLWRRVADGPLAPTRRIVGGGDPLAPSCPSAGTLAEPACQGPFPRLIEIGGRANLNPGSTGWLGPEDADGIPQLSADGRTVALIGNPIGSTNVYLVDMSDGLSRRQAVRELTREIPVSSAEPAQGVNTLANIPINGFVFDLTISGDGKRIAFATARQQFALAPPSLIGVPPASLGLSELYLIDLDGETLRRVTHGDGGGSEASFAAGAQLTEVQHGLGATTPSFGAAGNLIAFASDASNLVEGDGNDAKDAFLVDVAAASREIGSAGISPGPRQRRAKRRWRLTLSAFSLPDGRVRLVAVVPSAGKLRAGAWGKLGAEARARRLAAADKPARRRAGGPVKLTLALPRPLRGLAHSREGVYAMAHVSFHRGRKTLHGELQVRFHAHPRHGHGGRG